MKNRLLSILLCLALAVSLLPMAALAAEEAPVPEMPTEPAPQETISPAFITLCEVGGYAVTALPSQNGSVSAFVNEDGTITLMTAPDKGYCLETIAVTDAEGNEIELENLENGCYVIAAPVSNATVTVTFMEDNTMLNFCMDVTYRDWYYDAVLFVYLNGIMSGVSPVSFAPNETVTRAMAATILYRLEGEPAFMNDSILTDVAEGAYYEKAVVWANGKGIVTGFEDGSFRPEESITREQLAVLLYRYAQYHGQGFADGWMFRLDFADAGEISDYASEAMHWCVMNGIINGTDDQRLEPKGTATRAQAAAMLQAFVGIMAEDEGEPETAQPGFPDYTGTYEDGNFNTITFTPAEDWPYDVEVGVYRLTTFQGRADYMDGALELVLEDPNGGELTATFYPAEEEGTFELIVTTSTWPLLAAQTVFGGFRLK